MKKIKSKKLDAVFIALENRKNPKDIIHLIEKASKETSLEKFETYWLKVAKAETENRLGLPEDALVTIQKAREEIPSEEDTKPILAELSRIAALIHSWRPRSEMATFELLCSIAEEYSRSKNLDDNLKGKLVIAGQLAVETGRYKEALTLLEPIFINAKMETTFEQRALWWKIKALNGLNDFENALNLLQENNKKTITNQRLAFLFNLERLVSMANLDAENIVIRSLEKEICADLPEDKGAFEYSEFDEARLDACLIQSDVEILEILSRLIFRYKEDRLLAKLAKSLIRQGEIYSKNKGHKDAAIAFSEAAALIAENQYFGLRVHLLKAAHRYDGRYSENNYHAIFDEFNQASRYLDIEPLGRGGQGQVSKALDLFTGKLCAIKRFRIEDTNRAKEFTYNEIRTGLKILSRTQSDRILSVRDFFLLSNELHAVAPLGSGTEISDTEVLNMTKSERFELCIQILDLVEEIHFAGIIHNDLKPQNFLLNHETGIVEIIDFGISRLSDEFSISSTVVGTNKFMAPEILRGDEEPNFSSDVYSLGVIFKNWLPAAESFLPKFLRKKSDYKKLINQMLHTNQEERPEINFIKRRFQEMLEELIRGHSQRKG